eukprot:5701091-Karenia_brevis.AAC.1
MVSIQCPLYKRKVGKLFPGDSKPRSFIQPYDTQHVLAYGDMRLVEINAKGTDVTPTLVMDINAMAFGTDGDDVFSPHEVEN